MWARYRDIFFDNWNKHQETKCFGYLSSNTKKFNLDDLAKSFLFHKYLGKLLLSRRLLNNVNFSAINKLKKVIL